MCYRPPLFRERAYFCLGMDEENTRSRVYCLVDGFNLYHALNWFERDKPCYLDHSRCGIDHTRYRKYKWISLKRLAECYVASVSEQLVGVEYFTTYAHWDPAKEFRHRRFVMAQVEDEVHVTFGKFKLKNVACKANCKLPFGVWTEKQTDVNIAVRLIELARQNAYDKAIVISGDSDLVPAIKLTREIYPEKHIAVAVPIGRRGDEINQAANSKYKMTEEQLARSVLPDKVVLKTGVVVLRPAEWQ